MSVQRRVFPESFKREAVDRVANSGPPRNWFADDAARTSPNSGRIRAFTSRSEDAHNSNVLSIDALDIP